VLQVEAMRRFAVANPLLIAFCLPFSIFFLHKVNRLNKKVAKNVVSGLECQTWIGF
jgi:hypothetical protein